MKFLAVLMLVFAHCALAHEAVIYGEDNRKDLYEVTNKLHLKLASATAGMVSLRKFKKTETQGVFEILGAKSLTEVVNACSGEKYEEQISSTMCSGFLVGPDTLVTAGHCYKSFATPEAVCKSFIWVFDYALHSADADPTKNIPRKNLYLCKSITAAVLDNNLDYAVIKLDRPVEDREPLKFRTSGKIADSANLIVIGNPTGLPTKVADGALVTANNLATKFNASLDTFQGNSGSAVFDAETGLVEGILIQGKTDYYSRHTEDNSCQTVNVCDQDGSNCSAGLENGPIGSGEVVLRITSLLSDIEKALAQ